MVCGLLLAARPMNGWMAGGRDMGGHSFSCASELLHRKVVEVGRPIRK